MNKMLNQERVEIPNKNNEKLVGYLEFSCAPPSTNSIHNQSERNPLELVILCHGLLGSMNNLCYPTMAKELSEMPSCHVFRFDFSGEGPLSQGAFEYGNYVKQVHDLHSVISYWKQHENKYRIRAIVGHSKGSNVVLMYHDLYSDPVDAVPLVVAVSGRFDLSKSPATRFTKREQQLLKEEGKFLWKKKSWFFENRTVVRACWVTQHDMELRSRIHMETILKHQATNASNKTKYIVVHGTNDSVIPVEDASEIQNCLTKDKCQLIVVPEADHSYTQHTSELKHILKSALLHHQYDGMQSKL